MKLRSLVCFLALSIPAVAQNNSDAPTPQIILPSQQQTNAPASDEPPASEMLAGQQPPAKFVELGDLANDIVAYFAMDDSSLGGLTWSAKKVSVTATDAVVRKQDGARTYLDFSTPGARLVFTPPMPLGLRFTIMAWVQTPMPKNHGDVWHGSGKDGLLFVGASSLGHLWTDSEGLYAQTGSPLNGWYHMALTCDGHQVQAFLNATPLDVATSAISYDLGTEGSSPYPEFNDKTRCAGIDEQYVFDRVLTADEIKQMMDFSKPGN